MHKVNHSNNNYEKNATKEREREREREIGSLLLECAVAGIAIVISALS